MLRKALNFTYIRSCPGDSSQSSLTCESVDQCHHSPCLQGGLCLSDSFDNAKDYSLTDILKRQEGDQMYPFLSASMKCRCSQGYFGKYCQWGSDRSQRDPGSGSTLLLIGFVTAIILAGDWR